MHVDGMDLLRELETKAEGIARCHGCAESNDSARAPLCHHPEMAVSERTEYRIEPVDLASADDTLLRELNDLQNEIAHERAPEEPPIALEVLALRVRNRPGFLKMREWIVRAPAGQLVARGFIARWEADTNQHLRDANIDVAPAHRRRGVAKRLLREIVDAAGSSDDIVIEFAANDRVPASEAFLRRIGAHETLRTHINQVPIAEIDRGLVHEWAMLDPTGYRLVWIDGDVPEELMGNVIVAYDTMNTAPRGEAMEDWHSTPDLIRQFDRSRNATGRLRRLLLAIEDATGATAGFTEMSHDPLTPHLLGQGGTAVVPSHRGRGIGKWLKATMLERVLDEWPGATLVRTGNADANAPMLAINTRLGFRPAWATIVYEVNIADARRYAGSVPV
ncbi:MAG: GNAT family N-acetyltransferase [Chloroflexi bacterium]|nr:MAG: GNAT family N-acetyltransferase [Chloroflexota bacterium]